jgi:hypothetical protein
MNDAHIHDNGRDEQISLELEYIASGCAGAKVFG